MRLSSRGRPEEMMAFLSSRCRSVHELCSIGVLPVSESTKAVLHTLSLGGLEGANKEGTYYIDHLDRYRGFAAYVSSSLSMRNSSSFPPKRCDPENASGSDAGSSR